MSEQSYRSAGTLLAQLASGETTSVALVNHYFSRMAQFNKPLNAVVQQHYALALEAAARADRERLEGRARGVLHGLPCTVKESFDVQGWLTTSGAHYLKDNRATPGCSFHRTLTRCRGDPDGKNQCADDDCRLANL